MARRMKDLSPSTADKVTANWGWVLGWWKENNEQLLHVDKYLVFTGFSAFTGSFLSLFFHQM